MNLPTPSRLARAACVLTLVAAVASCGDDSDNDSDNSDQSAAGVTVTDAWSRPTGAAPVGAAYFTIESSTDDALIGLSAPDVAGRVELHETVPAELADDDHDDHDPDDTASGAVTMRAVDELPLPAGDPVQLAPGGLHVMLMELPGPLEDGTSYELTLEFTEADDQTVTVEVTSSPPDG